MHQNSLSPMLTDRKLQNVKPLRYAHKIVDGRDLFLLVVPNGGRYWRYNYRFIGNTRPSPSAHPPMFRWRKPGHGIKLQGGNWQRASIRPPRSRP